MTCRSCLRTKTRTLIDGVWVCNVCERWRQECEARWLLSLPDKESRRAYLDGDGTRRRKGVRGMRGDAAVTALEDLARKIWSKGR